MNYKEILDVLKTQFEDVEDFAFSGGQTHVDGVGKMKEIAKYGGEGKGEEWWRVRYFPEHDVYIKVDGWYSSYNGTDFEGWDDSCKEVRPKEKLITVYE